MQPAYQWQNRRGAVTRPAQYRCRNAGRHYHRRTISRRGACALPAKPPPIPSPISSHREKRDYTSPCPCRTKQLATGNGGKIWLVRMDDRPECARVIAAIWNLTVQAVTGSHMAVLPGTGANLQERLSTKTTQKDRLQPIALLHPTTYPISAAN